MNFDDRMGSCRDEGQGGGLVLVSWWQRDPLGASWSTKVAPQRGQAQGPLIHSTPPLVPTGLWDASISMDMIPRFGRQHSLGASAKRSGARITTSRPQPIMNCNKQDRSSSRVACDRPEGKRSSPLPWLVTPPRSEGAVSMGGQILRCAQDDRAGALGFP